MKPCWAPMFDRLAPRPDLDERLAKRLAKRKVNPVHPPMPRPDFLPPANRPKTMRQRMPKRWGCCSRCGGKNDRLPQAYCKDCHAAYIRENRARHSDLAPLAKKRANARAYAKEYLKRGKLKKGSCEIAGCRAPTEMHHEDYCKPLQVRWFCRAHHLELHGLMAPEG